MNPGHRGTRTVLLAIGAAVFFSLAASAEDEIPPLSFAFAHYTGSGIYAVENRSVQVYTLPFSLSVRSREGHPWGLEVTLPVTLGFFDFQAADVLEQGLPEHVGTASLIPGVRFDILATERWRLAPFVEAGVAEDFEGGGLVYVAGVGLNTETRFPWEELLGLVRNRLVAARGLASGSDESETYTELRTAFELTMPLGLRVRGHGTELTPFVAGYLYYRPPTQPPTRSVDEPAEDTWVQGEIGLTIGPRPSAKWWKIPIPRLGLSYRFGDGADAIRIVFGAPF